MSPVRTVAIGLGSNLGDREAQIRRAAGSLAERGLSKTQLSKLYPTAPVDCLPEAPEFLNAALIGRSDLAPAALLELCLTIEAEMGRPHRRRRSGSCENRLIDIDLLLVGDLVLRTESLTLPHPELRRRAFVLRPLAELAPHWRLPPDNARIQECLDRLISSKVDNEPGSWH